jgi:integrase
MRRDAVVPIDDELTTMIEAQQDRARRRFPDTAVLLPRGHANPDGRFPIHTGTFDMRLKRWLADIAVTDEYGRPAHLTPHQWRHTFVICTGRGRVSHVSLAA